MSIKIAILGMGNMGCNYAKMIDAGLVNNVEIKAVTRVSDERKKLKELFEREIEIYHSAEKIFEAVRQNILAIDAVLITTPHMMHAEHTIEAMQLGLHVLCDKPAGVYSCQARFMREEVKKYKNIVFTMMFNQRMNPAYQKIKKIVDKKIYGKLKRVHWVITDWYRPNNYYKSVVGRGTWEKDGGGILLNQCPHNLDLLQWIFGMPKTVQAFCNEGKYHDILVEDEVTAYFEFSDGVTGVFYSTTGEASGINRLEVAFEDGLLVCENGKIKIYELGVVESEYRKTATNYFTQPKGYWREIACKEEKYQHAKLLQNFVDTISGQDSLFVDGVEGGKSLILSNAMYLSSWKNKKIKVPKNQSEEYALEKMFAEEMKKKIDSYML